jgi:DNA primase
MISQETINEVRDLPVEEVIAHFFNDLKKKGANYQARCPFHDEKSASFTVTPAKGIFKCFGCGKGGDAIQFVIDYEKLNFEQAVEAIAKGFNIPVQFARTQQPSPELLDRRRTLAATMSMVAANLVQSHTDESKQYLRARGVGEDDIIEWGIGYAPGGGHLVNMADKISDKDTFRALGLINTKDNNDRDAIWERITFPIVDHRLNTVAIGARTLKDDVKPKYINSPENELYKKGEVLYGLNRAQDGIRKHGYAILVEGYTDVISMHRAGATNTVATCGTALTEKQVKLLKKFTGKVMLMRDADDAGRDAMLRDIDLLVQEGIDVMIAELNPGEDPDNMARMFDSIFEAEA